MNIQTAHHGYRETGKFAALILDYLDELPALIPAHAGFPSVDAIREAIENRRSFPTDRIRLVEALKDQYSILDVSSKAQQQIGALLDANTYTITTAHQCNIFLGPLYIIFKALHAIRIADELNRQLPAHRFVPVFYLGSEDADLHELNHIHLLVETLEWKTNQQGAVGRMIVDDALLELVEYQSKQLNGLPYASQWIDCLRSCYRKGSTIAAASFRLLHELFAARGLIVLQPDQSNLKRCMIDLFWTELTEQPSMKRVQAGNALLEGLGYAPQAHARAINLFYLQQGSRERIEAVDGEWKLADGSKHWNEAQLKNELDAHPERFSPNVILRGVYQETILPNLLYVGGGGELAYWLQFKPLFEHYKIPFPLLQLRASIQWVDVTAHAKMQDLSVEPVDLFRPAEAILNMQIRREQIATFDLSPATIELERSYDQLKQQAVKADPTLSAHVESLRVQALKKVAELEKKMLRAERRKRSDRKIQLEALQRLVFPGNGLQERWENVGYYFAKYGPAYFDLIYKQLDPFGKSFTWLIESSQ